MHSYRVVVNTTAREPLISGNGMAADEICCKILLGESGSGKREIFVGGCAPTFICTVRSQNFQKKCNFWEASTALFVWFQRRFVDFLDTHFF